DDSLSMGEPDYYSPAVQARVNEYAADIKKDLEAQLPGRIQATRAKLEELRRRKGGDDTLTASRAAERQLAYFEKLEPQHKSHTWRPTGLHLAQHLLRRDAPDWLKHLQSTRKLKVHVFHLDAGGRLARLRDADGFAGDLIDGKPEALDRTRKAVQGLVPSGN